LGGGEEDSQWTADKCHRKKSFKIENRNDLSDSGKEGKRSWDGKKDT